MHVIPFTIHRPFAAFAEIGKGEEIRRGMVEDAVQDDPHPPGMTRIHEMPEDLFIPERGVDPHVVGGVILVVARGKEDGVEVQGVHAQRLDVVQVVNDPLHIAAEEIPAIRDAAPRSNTPGIVGWIAVREAFRKDLIEDGISNPGRYAGLRKRDGNAGARQQKRGSKYRTQSHSPPIRPGLAFTAEAPIFHTTSFTDP